MRTTSHALLVVALCSVCAFTKGCARRDEPQREASQALSAAPRATPPSPSAALAVSSPSPLATASPCITPESVGGQRLVGAKADGPDETAALVAARAELERLLQVPSEFYVVVQTVGDLVLLELWHEAAFARENCGKPGNPGEKSRTLGYDVKKRRIVSSKVWQ